MAVATWAGCLGSIRLTSCSHMNSRWASEECSASKLVIENETGKILGAHLLGHEAEELINVFAVAIAAGYGARDLERILFSYPTRSSDIQYMF